MRPQLPSTSSLMSYFQHLMEPTLGASSAAILQPPTKRQKLLPADRTMIYVKQETEDSYTPLHLVRKYTIIFNTLISKSKWSWDILVLIMWSMAC